MNKSRLSSILHGLCPRCRKGPIFRSSLDVHDRCSSCGLLFSREHGYFLGAMYMEYGLAAAFLALVTFVVQIIWGVSLGVGLAIAIILFLPLIPLTMRLSRTVWIYWDNRVDPQEP